MIFVTEHDKQSEPIRHKIILNECLGPKQAKATENLDENHDWFGQFGVRDWVTVIRL